LRLTCNATGHQPDGPPIPHWDNQEKLQSTQRIHPTFPKLSVNRDHHDIAIRRPLGWLAEQLTVDDVKYAAVVLRRLTGKIGLLAKSGNSPWYSLAAFQSC
jgi:hypothetical protein